MRELLQVNTGAIKEELILKAANLSDIALDNVYGYGLSNDINSFGYKANKLSATYGLHEFFYGEGLGINDIESVASAVHDGWSFCTYYENDPKYLTQPHKKTNRLILADTPYSKLPEAEKEKDRVIAKAIIDFLKSY